MIVLDGPVTFRLKYHVERKNRRLRTDIDSHLFDVPNTPSNYAKKNGDFREHIGERK